MVSTAVPFKKKIEELFKHSLIYGLTSSLQSFLGFIMLPILTVYYTPEVFGVYSILLLLSALASAIFYFGASSALARFYFEEDSDLYKKKIVTTSLIVTIFGAILLIIVGIIFSKFLSLKLFQTNKYAIPIILILTGTAFTFLLNLMTLLLRYERKSFQFFISTLAGVIFNFLITYVLLARFNYGILAPILGLLISNAICFLILLTLRIRLITIDLEKSHFKIILIFGIQSSMAGLFFYILEWVDRLIIKDLLNLSDVGIYSLGYRLGAIMNIFIIMPFSLIWGPMRMQYAKNEDSSNFTGKVVSYYTVLGVLILSIIILFGENLMELVFVNKSYDAAASILPIIMFSLLFYGYQSILDFGIYLHKKIYYYIIISIAAIFLNIVLNYWLIPKFGYIAAAYVTLLTYIFTSFTIYLISNTYFRIKIESLRVLSALITVPALYVSIHYLEIENIFFKIIIAFIIWICFYNLWLDESERRYLVSTKNFIKIKLQ